MKSKNEEEEDDEEGVNIDPSIKKAAVFFGIAIGLPLLNKLVKQ